MRHKPVGKLSRALGIPVTPKGAAVLDRHPYRPGEHGRGRRTVSGYALRLQEKQRLRAQYFVGEAQLRRAFDRAARREGPTGGNLLADLERRADATVLRAGFARTVYQARQMVSHGHFTVDGRRITVPSLRLADEQVLQVHPSSLRSPLFEEARVTAGEGAPRYLEVRRDLLAVRHLRAARRDEVPVLCDEQLVVEFYAR